MSIQRNFLLRGLFQLRTVKWLTDFFLVSKTFDEGNNLSFLIVGIDVGVHRAVW
jgi:hypothetical protein